MIMKIINDMIIEIFNYIYIFFKVFFFEYMITNMTVDRNVTTILYINL